MKRKLLALIWIVGCTLSITACGLSGDEEAAPEMMTGPEARADEAGEAFGKESDDEGNEAESESIGVEEETEPAGEEQTRTEKEEEEPKETRASGSGRLSDNLYDFQVSIDGAVYQFPMRYSDFEAFGWEYDGDDTETLSSNQYASVEVWVKDGCKVYTEFANMSMDTVPFSESMVAGITLEDSSLDGCDWEIMLPGGIQYGMSNAEEIREAYGDPSSVYDGDLYYKMSYKADVYRRINLYVYKDDHTLKQIEMENLMELESAGNSVDEAVSDIAEAHVL